MLGTSLAWARTSAFSCYVVILDITNNKLSHSIDDRGRTDNMYPLANATQANPLKRSKVPEADRVCGNQLLPLAGNKDLNRTAVYLKCPS